MHSFGRHKIKHKFTKYKMGHVTWLPVIYKRVIIHVQ